VWWRGLGLAARHGSGTPLGDPGDLELLAERRPETWAAPRVWVAAHGRGENRARTRLIREKSYRHDLRRFAPVIGRGLRSPFDVAAWTGRLARAVAGRSRCSINQRASMAAGVLFEPGNRQCVISLRRLAAWSDEKVVAFQELRDADKETPRGLGFVIQGTSRVKKPIEITSIVTLVKSAQNTYVLWKSVQITGLRPGAESLATSGSAAL